MSDGAGVGWDMGELGHGRRGFFARAVRGQKGEQNVPTMPKTAVKMLSMKMLAKLEMAVAQPRTRAAAAGLGQVSSVTKAGVVRLK